MTKLYQYIDKTNASKVHILAEQQQILSVSYVADLSWHVGTFVTYASQSIPESSLS